MKKEIFKINKIGENYEVVQKIIDIVTPKFIDDIREEIERKVKMTKQQIDQLPKQQQLMEDDIKILERRLRAIKPHLKDIKKKIEETDVGRQTKADAA